MNYEEIIENFKAYFKTYTDKEKSTDKAKAFVAFVKEKTEKSIGTGSAHNFLHKKGSMTRILEYFNATRHTRPNS